MASHSRSVHRSVSPSRLRAGVIGIGWAGQQHIAHYAASDRVDLVAIAGAETDVLASLSQTYDVPRTYADWTELLAAGDLDIVSIALPTGMHAPVAVAALEAGIHVLTEKPMASNAEQATRMVAAARANERVLDVAFNFRQRGEIAALKQEVDRGAFGRIYTAKASWMRRSGIPGLGTWFTDKDRAGGGPLIDIGVHILDFTLHLLGEPQVVAVSANTYSEFGPRGRGGMPGLSPTGDFEVEDYAICLLRLADGGTVLLEASWAVLREEEDEIRLVLYGSEGGTDVRLAQPPAGGVVQLFQDDEHGAPADAAVAIHEHGGHDEVVRRFLQKVLADSSTWPAHDGSEALARSLVIDAAYRSAIEGREVSLQW